MKNPCLPMDACLWPCLPTDGYAAVLDRAAPLCTLVYMLLCHVLTTYVCDSVSVGTLRLFYIGKAVRPCLYAPVHRHNTLAQRVYTDIYTLAPTTYTFTRLRPLICILAWLYSCLYLVIAVSYLPTDVSSYDYLHQPPPPTPNKDNHWCMSLYHYTL